jgi:hypothetical protein
MKPDTQNACIVVHTKHPSGCTDPRLDAYLGTRPGTEDDRDRDGHEYPRSPDRVNGFECHHGSLGIYAWSFDGRVQPGTLEYERLAYVDAYKLAACVKTLATIQRRFGKMADTRGRAAGWSESVARFAEATGAKWIAFDATAIGRIDAQEGREPRDLRGARFVFVPLREAPGMLRALEASLAPKAAVERVA